MKLKLWNEKYGGMLNREIPEFGARPDCDRCGKGLVDNSEEMFTVYPPRKSVHCPNCGATGERVCRPREERMRLAEWNKFFSVPLFARREAPFAPPHERPACDDCGAVLKDASSVLYSDPPTVKVECTGCGKFDYRKLPGNEAKP